MNLLMVRSIAADWAQLSESFRDQPSDVRRVLRKAFYCGNACALSQVTGVPPTYVDGKVVIDAGMVTTMHDELLRFVQETPT